MKSVLIFLVVCALVAPAQAVNTAVWKETSWEQFVTGEIDNVSLSTPGEISLAPDIEVVFNSNENYLWSLIQDEKGNLYAGSGSDGIVYRIDADGEHTVLYDSSESEVHSLALDENNNLYVGTAPRGIIYRITPKGEVSVFKDLDDPYIWVLLFDQEGNLYAGTGDRGKIYKITPAGEVIAFYESNQKHILALLLTREGFFIAGSEPDGIIYKISSEGTASVLYEAEESEIHCLVEDGKGNIYAGTAEGGMGKKRPRKNKQPVLGGVPRAGAGTALADFIAQVGQQAPAGPPGETAAAATVRPTAAPVARNTIYKITPEGLVRDILRLPQTLFLDLLVDSDGNVLAGTGNDGKLYRISPKEEVAIVSECSESQILTLLAVNNGDIYFTTGNNGKVFKLLSSYAARGTFESSVYDTRLLSQWGAVSWNSSSLEGTAVTFSIRTGNTSKPDSTWSAWSSECEVREGTPVPSPPARFIQYRATLTTSQPELTPILYDITLSYQSYNQPPSIISISVSANGLAERSGVGGTASAPPPPQANETGAIRNSKKITLNWRASDPNNDRLIYNLYFRGEEEVAWKKLEEEWESAAYTWDTESVPDGYYLVKLVASDSLANPPALSHEVEKVSQPFLIDNTAPVVKITSYGNDREDNYLIKGEVFDTGSYVYSLEYSVDAEEWVPLLPADGIADGHREDFTISLSALTEEEHTLVVRARDAVGNVGAGKTVLRVK